MTKKSAASWFGLRRFCEASCGHTNKKIDEMQFEIKNQWNGLPIDHEPVTICLRKSADGLDIEVESPFFNDPAPSGPAGKPFPQLWDYEVVEAFFLGKDDKYLEVELSPHGQHLVLLLNGRRNMIKDELSLEYTSSIEMAKMTWTGKTKIPFSYFPVSVNKFNAYAIHGTGLNRTYEALYPIEKEKNKDPDFHRLEYFAEINFEEHLENNKSKSPVWLAAE